MGGRIQEPLSMQVIIRQSIVMGGQPVFCLLRSVVFRVIFEHGRVAQKRAKTLPFTATFWLLFARPGACNQMASGGISGGGETQPRVRESFRGSERRPWRMVRPGAAV